MRVYIFFNTKCPTAVYGTVTAQPPPLTLSHEQKLNDTLDLKTGNREKACPPQVL